MNARIFQHVPFEGPGMIADWLKEQQARIRTTHFHQGEFPPDIDEVDVLIVMGGPMSVHDSGIHPWLEIEKAFILAALESGKPVLGICLGAQLIASALGAKVLPGPVKEIGWFPVFGTDPAEGFRLPETLPVLHWHGETFDLPPDSTLLASTPECRNQAFQVNGKKVIGLQFHLETTPDTLDLICENCADELVPGEKIMSAEEMRSRAPDHLESANRMLRQLLEYLTENL